MLIYRRALKEQCWFIGVLSKFPVKTPTQYLAEVSFHQGFDVLGNCPKLICISLIPTSCVRMVRIPRQATRTSRHGKTKRFFWFQYLIGILSRSLKHIGVPSHCKRGFLSSCWCSEHLCFSCFVSHGLTSALRISLLPGDTSVIREFLEEKPCLVSVIYLAKVFNFVLVIIQRQFGSKLRH